MTISRIIDYVSIRLIVAVFIAMWINYFLKKAILSIAIAIGISLIIVYILKQILKRIQIKKPLSQYFRTLVLLGGAKIAELYMTMFPNDNRYIRPVMRFSDVNMDDIALIYREANGRDTLVICKNAPRNVRLFSSSLNIDIQYLTERQFLIKLRSHNLLPDILDNNQHMTPYSLRSALHSSLDYAHSGLYLYSGTMLAFLSIFVPYKLYYLITASILLVLSLISKILNHTT